MTWIRPVSRIDRSAPRRSDAGSEPDRLGEAARSAVDDAEEICAFGNEAAEQVGHGRRIGDAP